MSGEIYLPFSDTIAYQQYNKVSNFLIGENLDKCFYHFYYSGLAYKYRFKTL